MTFVQGSILLILRDECLGQMNSSILTTCPKRLIWRRHAANIHVPCSYQCNFLRVEHTSQWDGISFFQWITTWSLHFLRKISVNPADNTSLLAVKKVLTFWPAVLGEEISKHCVNIPLQTECWMLNRVLENPYQVCMEISKIVIYHYMKLRIQIKIEEKLLNWYVFVWLWHFFQGSHPKWTKSDFSKSANLTCFKCKIFFKADQTLKVVVPFGFLSWKHTW